MCLRLHAVLVCTRSCALYGIECIHGLLSWTVSTFRWKVVSELQSDIELDCFFTYWTQPVSNARLRARSQSLVSLKRNFGLLVRLGVLWVTALVVTHLPSSTSTTFKESRVKDERTHSKISPGCDDMLVSLFFVCLCCSDGAVKGKRSFEGSSSPSFP